MAVRRSGAAPVLIAVRASSMARAARPSASSSPTTSSRGLEVRERFEGVFDLSAHEEGARVGDEGAGVLDRLGVGLCLGNLRAFSPQVC